jgi:hypothetical protein
MIIIFTYFANNFLGFFVFAFKNIGNSYKIDDAVMTYAGSIGDIVNSISRLFWGIAV